MPALETHYWTADEVRALPEDGLKHECIDGVHLVTPAPIPDHQRVVLALFRLLDPIVTPLAPVELFPVAVDLELVERSMVQPDLFVGRARPGRDRARQPTDWGTIHLAVEVLSPGTARHDKGLKREFYLRAGVEEYWIVDLSARLVERWHPGDARPEVIHGRLSWRPIFAPIAVEIDLPRMFATILDG